MRILYFPRLLTPVFDPYSYSSPKKRLTSQNAPPMHTHIAGHAAKERSAGMVAAIAGLCVSVNATYVVAAIPEAAEDNTTTFLFVIFTPLLRAMNMYSFSNQSFVLKCTRIQSSKYYSNILLIGK